MRRAALLATAVLAAACAGDDGAGPAEPAGRVELRPSTTLALEDIYDPPSPLPGSAPGDLIAVEPVASPTDVPEGTRAWRLLYRSTGVDGSPVGVTGVVIVPPGAAGTAGEPRPILAWAHGTTGVADTCAPSRRGSGSAWLADLLDRGFVVVATDYEGLGTPGVHPYMVGDSAARSVLDAARAAAAFPAAGSAASAPVIVAGHSQGGHAALFTASVAGEYAPDVPLAGVVAVAPPTDLAAMAAEFTGSPVLGGFVVTVAAGYVAAYPELALDDVLTPNGVGLTEVAHEACLDQVIAGAMAAGEPVSIEEPLAVDAWSRRVRQNIPPAPPADVPALVVQGEQDPIVRSTITEEYATRACAGRSTLELALYPGADHSSVLSAGRDDVLAWIDARLAGEAAAGCPA